YNSKPYVLKDIRQEFLEGNTFQIHRHHLTIGIDQEVMRDCSDTVKLGSCIVPSLQVRHLRPFQSVDFDRLQPVVLLAGVIQRYTQDSKIAVAEVLVCFHEVRIFFPTGSTPRRPEIDQHILTSEVREAYRLVIDIILGELWSC